MMASVGRRAMAGGIGTTVQNRRQWDAFRAAPIGTERRKNVLNDLRKACSLLGNNHGILGSLVWITTKGDLKDVHFFQNLFLFRHP